MGEGAEKSDRSAPTLQIRDGLIALLPHLRAFARGLCGRTDRADDLVQEAVLRAWSSAASFVPGSNLRAWVFTIARNHFLNELRRTAREVQFDDGHAEALAAMGTEPDEVMRLTDVERALARLPEERREALLLVGASGFSYDEAARICGVAAGTMKSRVSRGRAQLAAVLGEKDE